MQEFTALAPTVNPTAAIPSRVSILSSACILWLCPRLLESNPPQARFGGPEDGVHPFDDGYRPDLGHHSGERSTAIGKQEGTVVCYEMPFF